MDLTTPAAADLGWVSAVSGSWQNHDWPGHLHPGDLGWHSMSGADKTAQHVRVWIRSGTPAAIGVLGRNEAVVEARGAHALLDVMRRDGWVDDEPWTPLCLDLGQGFDHVEAVRHDHRALVRIPRDTARYG